MATRLDTHECKVAARPHVSNLLSFRISAEFKILRRSSVIVLLARPVESFNPRTVAEPIADKVSVTLWAVKMSVAVSRMLKKNCTKYETYSIDQHRDFLKDAWNKAMEGLHPVPLEKEVAIDVKIA